MKKNAELHEAVNNVEAHSVELEQYSRQANVRVFGVGLPEEREENTKQVMMKIINSVMKVEINNSDIVAAHRLPGKPGKPRPIIVRFINKDVKHEVIRERKRLSGHNIGMQDDLCQGLQTTLNRLQNSESVKKGWSWNNELYFEDNDGKVYIIKYGQTLNRAKEAGPIKRIKTK